ncbi:MAG: MFS transporter [Candidatus Dormibacteria bacterium]
MRYTARAVTGRTFQSLSTRNYRLFFSGQLVSVTGSWLQTTAQAWLILELTHSAFMLGLLVMVQFLPNMLLQPFGGVITDRFPKRSLLYLTQGSFAVVAGVLGITVGLGIVQVWEVFLVVSLFGLINVVDGPTRQAFVPEMVGRDQLANAVALNSTVFNAARVVGPAAAGILIATVGTALCFDLNAISYIAVLAALYLMHPEELHFLDRAGQQVAGAVAQIKEGARHAARTPEVALVMVMMLVVGTFSYNFSVMIPALAKEGLHSGATTFGLLSASLGVGALGGALAVAYWGRATVTVLLAGCAVFGAFLLLAGQVAALIPAMALLMVTGAGMIVYSSMSNSIIQLFTPAALRGRVMSLYLWVFMGTTPIGSPIAGLIEQSFGSRATMTFGGMAALATAAGGLVWWARRKRRSGSYPASSPPLAEAPTA